MQNRAFGKNLFLVAFSRMVSLLSGVVVGLLLPKIFSVTDYGYFKIFTLYAVYTALLHFGFVDGLLLRLAGKNYNELNRENLRIYTRFFAAFQGVIFLIMTVFGIVFAKGEYRFVVLMLALNMVFVNLTTYYQFVSQATQRFGEYSAKSLIVSVCKLIFVGGLFVVYLLDVAEVSYRIYLIGMNLLDFGMLLWYVALYRDITFGKRSSFLSLKKDIFDIFKTGIVLTVAFQVSHLVLALDRQFVNLLFPTETFAVYSFAYNIVTMISTMISSLSVVLLPMLKSCTKEYVVTYYRKSMTVLSMVMAAALVCYFPLVPFIQWFLPHYSSSLEYIAIVLPAFLFTSGGTVVMFTVDKVLNMNFAFFVNSCVVLVLGAVTNTAAYLAFRSPQAISYASLAVMAIWFLLEGIRLGRKIKVGILKEFCYLSLVVAGFLAVVGWVESPIWGGLFFFAAFAALTAAFYFRLLRKGAKKLFQKLSR